MADISDVVHQNSRRIKKQLETAGKADNSCIYIASHLALAKVEKERKQFKLKQFLICQLIGNKSGPTC